MSETQALDRINTLSADAAKEEFHRCCAATHWSEAMAAARPYTNLAALEEASEAIWPLLTEVDWREAFAGHPMIGDLESLRAKFSTTAAWAGGEQAGTVSASEEVLRALAEGNATYRERFGYIFIVCATGKTAAEMLALLRARLSNPPEEELKIAAEEQKKITRLRLRKL